MDTSSSYSKYLIFSFLLSFFFLQLCSSAKGSYINDVKQKAAGKKAYPRRIKTTRHDFITTTPVTNPVTTPPVTNPVTTPAPGTTITTTTPPPIFTVPSPDPFTIPPAVDPLNPQIPATTFPPAVTSPGQSWCVAQGGVPESVIQVALDYACGIGGADCASIQQGQSCYNPNTLQNHASYAFNSYFQRNPVQSSCDFGGTAMITNLNPSSGSCIFPTWSASPSTTNPVTEGAAPVGSGTPTTVMNASNPALGGGFGEIPPTTDTTTSSSSSSSFKPFLSCIAVAVSIISYSARGFWNV